MPVITDENIHSIAQKLVLQTDQKGLRELAITAPENGAVFPPEIAAPLFVWQDTSPDARYWLVSLETEHYPPIYQITNQRQWMPRPETWETVKHNSVNAPAKLRIIGFNNLDKPYGDSSGTIRFSTSKDPVDALILYRQVPLPFRVGEKNFRKIKWVLGDIGSYCAPRVIMENIPVCASCHQVTADGSRISMELNYENDGGAQFVGDVQENIELTASDFMTWSKFPRPEILPPTRGLFARISPSGSHIVGTVNEISYAALTNDPAFCQLFFPTYGILAVYSVDQKTMAALPGADDTDYVQTNPEWRPDERAIAFARAETRNEYHESITYIKNHIENCGIEALNRRFPIQFDIWALPFNGGAGGTPEPLEGASENKMSNYFPRYSPDGKWLVYTRSKTGIMLQPDSELYILPAAGGFARKMQCNRNRMNSWHSWSPNSRWLIFSSKANTIYTEIFITHVDENGNDSPPVCLTRFSHEALAANLPEFVDKNIGRIQSITLKNESRKLFGILPDF